MIAPLLQIEDLHVNVGNKPIVKGLSLRIGAGEIHAIMGPNGSGKTTLANAVGPQNSDRLPSTR